MERVQNDAEVLDGVERETAKFTQDLKGELRRALLSHPLAKETGLFASHSVMSEEVGEVARELNDATLEGRPVNGHKLRTELVQVAAMACKMWLVFGVVGGRNHTADALRVLQNVDGALRQVVSVDDVASESASKGIMLAALKELASCSRGARAALSPILEAGLVGNVLRGGRM